MDSKKIPEPRAASPPPQADNKDVTYVPFQYLPNDKIYFVPKGAIRKKEDGTVVLVL